MTFDNKKTINTFDGIELKLSKYNINSFVDKSVVENYINDFGLKEVLLYVDADQNFKKLSPVDKCVEPFLETPYEPEFDDLCRLHYLALTRKTPNIMEFGSGFSTVILADAMKILYQHFVTWAKDNIRCESPFHVYSVEENQTFLEITESRLGNLNSYATVTRSSVDLITHDNRIATVYTSLPNISPEFIYLDGPSLFATTSVLNGLSFNSKCRSPISADIIRFEYFLEPGCLILIDGRTTNARFLNAYLKRNWVYQHDPIADIHYFELQEEPLGPHNQRKLEFCLPNGWLLE